MKYIVLGLVCSLLFAQDTTDEDELLALMELLNTPVVSTTKSAVSIQKAPGVVRVFSKDDIVKFGFGSLRELLHTIPGIQIEEYRAGHQLMWIRGVQQRYNNKTLILIDGVPLRDNYYGHFNLDEMLPLDHIETIEVINGPGSVLYGMNAFSGVISIKTKHTGASVSGKMGGHGKIGGTGEFSAEGFYGFANYFKTDGYLPTYSQKGLKERYDREREALYFYGSFTSDQLTLTGSYTDYSYPYLQQKSKAKKNLHYDYEQDRKPLSLSAKWENEVNKNLSYNLLAYFTHYTFTRYKNKRDYTNNDALDTYEEEYLNGRLIGSDLTVLYRTGNHSVTLGASFLQDSGDDLSFTEIIDGGVATSSGKKPNATDPNISRTDIGFFFQDLWELNDDFALTYGLRYDVLSDFENELNYRFALTTQLNKFYGKALFGTAFRVPSYREYMDVVAYNTSLAPEHLRTFELQGGFLLDKMDINLTLFYNDYTDFIKDAEVDSIGSTREIDDEYFFNADSRNVLGLEGFIKFFPTKNLSIRAGSTLILSAKEEIGSVDSSIKFKTDPTVTSTDITYISKVMLDLSVNLKLTKSFDTGFNARLTSKRDVPANYQEDIDSSLQNKDNANGYMLIDFLANYKITDQLKLSVKVNNLLNSTIYSPPYSGDGNYDVEWDKRILLAKLKYTF